MGNKLLRTALLVLTGQSCREPAPLVRQAEPLSGRVGIVAGTAEKACLQIANAAVPPGTPLGVVGQIPSQIIAAAQVGKREDSCLNPVPGTESTPVYEVQFAPGAPQVQLPAIGILHYPADFPREQTFHYCLSSEGVHFTIWDGPALTGKLRWHQYRNLGYDVEATCTAAELGQMPQQE